MLSNTFVRLAAGAAWALLGSSASAQTPQSSPRTVLEQVLACGQIVDDQARLSCFDGAVAQLSPAEMPEGGVMRAFAGEGDWTSETIEIDGSWKLSWQSAAEMLTIALRDGNNRFVGLIGSEFGGGENSSQRYPAGTYRLDVSAFGGEWRIQIVED